MEQKCNKYQDLAVIGKNIGKQKIVYVVPITVSATGIMQQVSLD
jgi:hypothetical protein